MTRPWKLEETTYGTVKNTEYEVAVLPLGATEPHNLHLPYGMDVFEGTIAGEQICAAAACIPCRWCVLCFGSSAVVVC